MPNATEYFGFTVTNVGSGPLTVAPSCTTAIDFHFAAASKGWPSRIQGGFQCEAPKYADCYPGNEKFASLESTAGPVVGQPYLPYYSPASKCPSEWTTAGYYAAADGSVPATPSGIFASDLWPYDRNSRINAAALPLVKAWTGVLDPKETIVLCCPSDHIANIQGGCVSSVGPLSSYSYSTICDKEFPKEDIVTVTSFQGSSWDPALISITPANTKLETVQETIGPNAAESYVVVHNFPAVAFVYQEGDSKDNAGNTVTVMSLASIGAIAAGFLAGVGLLLPW